MARLPSERYLVQQVTTGSGDAEAPLVSLFEDYTERVIASADISNGLVIPGALGTIMGAEELSAEDRSMACFWFGYFHSYANRNPEMAREQSVTEDGATGLVTVKAPDGTEIVKFSARDAGAAARAQKAIHDSALSSGDQGLAHFWCGYFYGAWAGS